MILWLSSYTADTAQLANQVMS